MPGFLTTLHDRINRIASVRLMLVMFAVMIGFAVVVISPVSPTDELKDLAGGRDVPDARFWRTPANFYSLLDAYGEEGRTIYLTRMAPIDLFTPLAQLVFLCVTLTVVLRAALPAGSRWQYLNLLPFLALIGDYLENASVITLILAYPAQLDALVIVSAGFTLLKVVVSIGSVLIILATLGVWAFRRVSLRSEPR